MSKIIIYSLIGCPFSEMAEDLINNNNIKNDLYKVSKDKKDLIKNKNNMNTFPQIFIKSNDKQYKLGGYTEFNKIINIINNNNCFNDTKNNISNYLNLNYHTDKKIILNLIDILYKK